MSIDLSAPGMCAEQRNPNEDERNEAVAYARLVLRSGDNNHLINLARQFLRAIGLSES